jgi:ketosteroid isomerase-like protein
MRHAAVVVFLVSLCSSMPMLAQNGKCTESAIREAVAKESVTQTNDSFFFSGALDKPVIGKPENEAAGKKIGETRANEKYPVTPQRIVVSSSGDMAYEYGTIHLSFDDKKTGHEDFTAAYLRVWKIEDGQCKSAAMIAEPEK